jgi:8-oxo-dGTP diphosphatase
MEAINWGSKEQPYYRPGPNPTVDLVVFRNGKKEKEVLLVRRAPNAAIEAGKWAIPGGFHDTPAKKGEPWQPGKESAQEAAIRELKEETGLELTAQNITLLQFVGIFEGNNRDPRDNKLAWSRSMAYAIDLGSLATSKVRGQDDADLAQWTPLKQVQSLAFDHIKILQAASTKLHIPFKPVTSYSPEL